LEDPVLREIGLAEMIRKGISKEDCLFVARKRGNDELAPPDDLFNDFNKGRRRLEKKFGRGSVEAHNKAFLDSDYARRFRAYILENPTALEKLEAICQRSRKKDVYFVCYEGAAKACHRRILLRISEERFGADVLIDGVEPTG
jgi:hypothetical protein